MALRLDTHPCNWLISAHVPNTGSAQVSCRMTGLSPAITSSLGVLERRVLWLEKKRAALRVR